MGCNWVTGRSTKSITLKLKHANLLTPHNLYLLKHYFQPSDIINTLNFLRRFHILNQETLEVIFNYRDPIYLHKCLQLLSQNSIINIDNGLHLFFQLCLINYIDELYETLLIMDTCKILTPRNFNILINHTHCSTLGYALALFLKNGIMTGESARTNFLKLCLHPYPIEFIYTSYCMQVANILNKYNIQHIFDYFSNYHHILFSNRHLWLEVDEHLFRLEHINN